MVESFFNRWGKKVYAEDIVPVKKEGYFAVLYAEGKVLLTFPTWGIDAPEVPGGSKRRGETQRESLYRTLYDETGLEFMLNDGIEQWSQKINFFADDIRPNGEYWEYEQTFILYEAGKFGFDVDRPRWKTPCNALAEWISIQDILEDKIKVNYAHLQALKALFAKNKNWL